MYGYAKDQKITLLKMELQDAYYKHVERIARAREVGKRRLEDLHHFYEDRMTTMRREEETLHRLHADTMGKIKQQSDALAVKLGAARSREAQAENAERAEKGE